MGVTFSRVEAEDIGGVDNRALAVSVLEWNGVSLPMLLRVPSAKFADGFRRKPWLCNQAWALGRVGSRSAAELAALESHNQEDADMTDEEYNCNSLFKLDPDSEDEDSLGQAPANA